MRIIWHVLPARGSGGKGGELMWAYRATVNYNYYTHTHPHEHVCGCGRVRLNADRGAAATAIIIQYF